MCAWIRLVPCPWCGVRIGEHGSRCGGGTLLVPRRGAPFRSPSLDVQNMGGSTDQRRGTTGPDRRDPAARGCGRSEKMSRTEPDPATAVRVLTDPLSLRVIPPDTSCDWPSFRHTKASFHTPRGNLPRHTVPRTFHVRSRQARKWTHSTSNITMGECMLLERTGRSHFLQRLRIGRGTFLLSPDVVRS